MAEAIFPSLQQDTLRMSALNVLRESILSGVLRPGEQLVQAQIAAQMNISRAPLREALRQLEQEGLVESIPYRGTFVTRVTRRDVLELYSLRGALESMAARLVISRCNDQDIIDLRNIIDRMSDAANADDFQAINTVDLEFHTRLCALSDHRHLLRTWQHNSNLIRRILSIRNRLNVPHVVVAMHEPIMKAIQDRDSIAVHRAIEAHCIDSGEALAAIWSDDEVNLDREVSGIHAHTSD